MRESGPPAGRSGSWTLSEERLDGLLSHLARRGLDPLQLSALLDLDRAPRVGGLIQLKAHAVYDTVEHVFVSQGGDAWLAGAVAVSADDRLTAIELAVQASATVADAIRRMCAYEAFWTSTLDLTVATVGAQVCVSARPTGDRRPGRQALVATAIGRLLAHLRHGTGEHLDGVRVELVYAPPTLPSALAEALEAPVRLGAPATLLWMPERVIRLPLRWSYQGYAIWFDNEITAQIARVSGEDDTQRALSEALGRMLAAGVRPTLIDAARQLGLSGRSLQRRLAEQGTSFTGELADLRKGMALTHLARPELTVSEIAFLLGYGHAPAFVRAFRAWTGTTPGQHRPGMTSGV